MDNQYIYIMKQPELGKKISELRKQKGLTQEELVEKCNINVRTIQRIEAGEVTPRSYTVKTILDVLGVDNSVYNLDTNKDFTTTQKRIFNLSWIFGIIYLIIGFIETVADIYQFTDDTSTLNTFIYSSVKIAALLSFVLFYLGFNTIGKVYNNKLLKIITYVLMVLFSLSELYDIFSMYSFNESLVFALVVKSIVFGVAQIIFGISLLQMKKQLGTLIQVNGILEIIVGVSLSTVVLASLGLFLLIPTVIIEIIVLYRLANK